MQFHMRFNLTEANKKKRELQQKAYELNQQHNNLILQWATGVGKSRAAGLCIEGKKTLIVVHQLVHKKNWEKDLAEHNLQPSELTFSTYAGIHTLKNKSYDIIVWDEAHHITERVLLYAKYLASNKSLFLSATISVDKLKLIKNLKKDIRIFRFNLTQAIDNGVLPAPQIYVKRLKLNGIVPDQVYITGNKKQEVKQCTYAEYIQKYKWERKNQYHIHCTQSQYYSLLTEDMEYWKQRYFQSKELWMKNRWLQLGSKRKRFLAECKTDTVKEFLKQHSNSRCLIFANSIKQCDALAGRHVSVHSKNDKDNTVLVEKFNTGKIDKLFAVSMLNEGMNLKNLEKVFMIQLDGSKLTTIQKQGRSLRNEEPQIYIFLMSDTREEDYFESFLEELDEKYVTYI